MRAFGVEGGRVDRCYDPLPSAATTLSLCSGCRAAARASPFSAEALFYSLIVVRPFARCTLAEGLVRGRATSARAGREGRRIVGAAALGSALAGRSTCRTTPFHSSPTAFVPEPPSTLSSQAKPRLKRNAPVPSGSPADRAQDRAGDGRAAGRDRPRHRPASLRRPTQQSLHGRKPACWRLNEGKAHQQREQGSLNRLAAPHSRQGLTPLRAGPPSPSSRPSHSRASQATSCCSQPAALSPSTRPARRPALSLCHSRPRTGSSQPPRSGSTPRPRAAGSSLRTRARASFASGTSLPSSRSIPAGRTRS